MENLHRSNRCKSGNRINKSGLLPDSGLNAAKELRRIHVVLVSLLYFGAPAPLLLEFMDLLFFLSLHVASIFMTSMVSNDMQFLFS